MKLKKIEKNILIGSLSVIGLGTILGTSLVGVNDIKPTSADNLLSEKNNNQRESNKIFLGSTLTSEDVKTLGWDQKTEITLIDWRTNAPKVTQLGNEDRLSGPFYNNHILQTIEIPSNITQIGKSVFQNASSLARVSFEDNSQLTMIGDLAFNNSSINEINIPNSVTKIGNDSFGNTYQLLASKITLPEDLKKGDQPLYGFSQDQWSSVEDGFAVEGDILYTSDAIKLGWKDKTTITLEDWRRDAPSVTKISPNFTEVNSGAFVGFTNLRSIEIPAQIIEINRTSFLNCSNLSSITFEAGSKLEVIREAAFKRTALTSITIPYSIVAIEGRDVFDETLSLPGSRVTIPSRLRGEPRVPKYGFNNAQWDAINWVPDPFTGDTLTKAAVQALGWNAKTQITLDDWATWAPNVTKLGDNISSGDLDGNNAPFSHNTVLESIAIPDSFTTINFAAFYKATALRSVTFGNSSQLTTINGYAFRESGIINIKIPTNVTAIGENAFLGAPNLGIVSFANNSKIRTIGEGAFWGAGITSIDVPDSVTSIGTDAFSNTTKLPGRNVSMLSSLKQNSTSPLYGFNQEQWNTIVWRATPFRGTFLTKADVVALGWDKKTTITLDDWATWAPNVTELGDPSITTGSGDQGPFSFNDSLQSIVIPRAVTKINFASFHKTTVLTTVTFEAGSQLTHINGYVFRQSSITTITLPNTLTVIGEHAFDESKITSINIPKLVKVLPTRVFNLAGSLKTVTFAPDSTLTQLGNYALARSGITSLVIPKTVTSIGTYAFIQTWSLKSFVFEEGSQITTLGKGVFQEAGFTDLYVPDSLTNPQSNSFDFSGSIINISMSSVLRRGSLTALYGLNQSQWDRITWRIQPFTGTTLTKFDVINLNWHIKESITLQDWKTYASKVISLGNAATTGATDQAPFENNTTLKSIVIPNTVVNINYYSFFRTTSLKTITFEEGAKLATIGNNAFEGSGINAINLPDSVTTISTTAFLSTTSLLGPQISMLSTLRNGSLTGLYGFTDEQWNSINWRIVQFRGTTLTKFDVINLNWHIKENITLEDWTSWAPNVTKISNFATSGTSPTAAFGSNTILKSIEIPAKVTEINYATFYSATSLTSVTFAPNSQLKLVGDASFRLSAINSIIIPATVTSIGTASFEGTASLTSVTIENASQLTTIADYAFNNASTLATINIPSKVTSIGQFAFQNTALTSINLPNSVTSVGSDAFTGTTSLLGPQISMLITLRQNSTAPLYGFTQAQWDTIAWRVIPFEGTTLTKTDVNALGWNLKTEITLDDWSNYAPNVTTISAFQETGEAPNAAFGENTTLTSIQIPSKITTINFGSFFSTTSLTSITFESGSELTTIGNAAFRLSALPTITIPASVTTIGNHAFQEVTSLREVVFEANSKLTTIGNGTFDRSGLTAIIVPDLVTTIGTDAFKETNTTLQGSKVSMQIALKQNSAAPKYGFTQAQWSTIDWRGTVNLTDGISSFLVDFTEESNIVSLAPLSWKASSAMTADARDVGLGLQYAIGVSTTDLIIEWGTFTELKAAIAKYSETKDILKSELNIFARLYLPTGTGIQGDMIGNVRYTWNKTPIKIYDNTTGTIANLFVTPGTSTPLVAGKFIRTYSRIANDWAASLSAEGNKSTAVKIISQNDRFNIDYYLARGIKLEVSPNGRTTWTTITAFNTQVFDASVTNKMQFRLSVTDAKFYQIYGSEVASTTPAGTVTNVVEKDIIAKIELTGIKASDLESNKLVISGTSHNLSIVEDPALYTVSGLSITEAKKYFEIKYSYDGTNYFVATAFINQLKGLRGPALNSLNLANFKVRYEFTTEGLNKYYSPEVANDSEATPSATKALNTTNVIKTIDVTTEILDISKIRLSGSTESIIWSNMDSIIEIGKLVKVEYGTYVRSDAGTISYVWSETMPTSIYTTTIPEGQTNYPMAIRFVPKTVGEKVEIGSINTSSVFTPSDTTNGYAVDVTKLVTIIRVDTTELVNKLLLSGYGNNLNNGATATLIETEAMNLVDPTFRNQVKLQYQISLPNVIEQWFSLDELRQVMTAYMANYQNPTSGIIIFNNGAIPGITISAKFAPKDPEKFTVASSPQEVVQLNTDKIKTNVDLREYVKVLQTQKVIPSGTSSSDLGTLTIPGMTAGNVQFGGRTYEQIVAILSSSIDVQFKAPGFHSDGWVSLSNITQVNVNNELYIRFVVKAAAKPNIELSLVTPNDYEEHLNTGFKLKLDLPIEIQVDSADLINAIILGGNTKNLTINDKKVYDDLVAKDPSYEGKVQVLYSIGKTPIALDPARPEKTEFTKTELINLLAAYTTDITLGEKQISARYALAPGVNPDDYIIKDTKQVNLIVNNVLLFINKANYYEIASTLRVSGTSSAITWGPELDELIRVLSKGLQIQYSTDETASASDPSDDAKWTKTRPTSISPSTKFLVVRLVTLEGYVFEEAIRLFNVNTDNVLLLIDLQSAWLQQILLTGNTRNINIDLTNFDKTLTDQAVPGKEFIVVQYYFGGTVPAGVDVPVGAQWFTATQIKAIFAALKGAKNQQELILFRNSLKARYSLTNEGYVNYRLNIDGVFVEEQFANQPAFIKDLVTSTVNANFQGYINLDLINKFTDENFQIIGSDKKPELKASNAIATMLDFYKNQTTVPFDIYYTNTEGDFSNTTYKLFGATGFITRFDSSFAIKLDTEGRALPIWFKMVARPGYQIWEKDTQLAEGKIIQITNFDIQPQITNPLTTPPDIKFESTTGTKFYQGEGSFSVYVSGTNTVVDSVYLNQEYPDIVPAVLKLQYNVSDVLYTPEELEEVKIDETKWSDIVPTDLRVGQYVMVRVAINNPIFTMSGGDTMTPQTRVRGLMVHANELRVANELTLTNAEIYGFTPLDGQTKIETATIVSDNLGNYLGADLQMSVNSEFYTDALGRILLDSNGIPIIKRDSTGATQAGTYKDAQGQEIIDSTGNPIPIWTITKDGSVILAPPLATGTWRTPMQMIDWSVPGSFTQEDNGMLDWRLFEGQTVRFSFVARVGQGTTSSPDFVFDSTAPSTQDIQLSNIKYIIPTNGINYKFDQNQLKDIEYVADDGGDIAYTGASHISSELIAIKILPNYTEQVLTGKQIEEQVKIDYEDKVQIKMQLTKKNGSSETAYGSNIGQFTQLQNGDVLTISLEAKDDNYSLPKPIPPLTIVVKNLFIKPLDKELFKFLRPNFTGALNGSGSFNIRVTNPNNPSETNETVLGIDQWYEYQVWHADKTIKTEWTRDESKINNLVNGDKVEWKLVNRDGVFENDYYNTLLSKSSTPEDIQFRVVNVEDKIEETVQEGIGSSQNINPDGPDGKPRYPETSGWVVSGLKIEITLDSIQQQQFEQALASFQPTFSGVNKFGEMSSNILNDTPISPEIVIVWYAAGEDGMPRKITDFRDAGLSNGDKVWAGIAPSQHAIENNLIIDESIASMQSKVFIVSGLTNIVNSTTQTLIISLITASSVILVGAVGAMVFFRKNHKIKNNKKVS